LRKIVVIFSLLGILLQTFNQAVIVGQYYANKDYIAKYLCENRNKPQLHCEGKCCLKKKLAKESKDQLPSSKNQRNKEVVNLYCTDIRSEMQYGTYSSVDKEFLNYNDMLTISYQHSVFRPPSA